MSPAIEITIRIELGGTGSQQKIMDPKAPSRAPGKRGRPNAATVEQIVSLLGDKGARFTQWELLAKAAGISSSTFKRLWRTAITNRLVDRKGRIYHRTNTAEVDMAPEAGGRDGYNGGAAGGAIITVSPPGASSKTGRDSRVKKGGRNGQQ